MIVMLYYNASCVLRLLIVNRTKLGALSAMCVTINKTPAYSYSKNHHFNYVIIFVNRKRCCCEQIIGEISKADWWI